MLKAGFKLLTQQLREGGGGKANRGGWGAGEVVINLVVPPEAFRVTRRSCSPPATLLRTSWAGGMGRHS